MYHIQRKLLTVEHWRDRLDIVSKKQKLTLQRAVGNPRLDNALANYGERSVKSQEAVSAIK